MRAKEIFKKLLQGALDPLENTCDGLIAGDGDKEVRKAGTCFKLTAELICRAREAGLDLIITHEPTYSGGDVPDPESRIDLQKRQLLEESGITVYRLHDHAHHRQRDLIHEGFLESLQLKIGMRYPAESLGVRRYELAEPLTVRELALRIREKLGVEGIRIVGKADFPVKTVCLGLGAVGTEQIRVLFHPGCDLFVTGEVGEVCTDELVRDACWFGENKSVLVLGHYGSEYAGMRYLAETMCGEMADTVFLEGGEVYRCL